MDNSQIDFLSKHSLHDTPVGNIDINFENQEIHITIFMYNETKKDYDILKLSFKKIENINMSALNMSFNKKWEESDVVIHGNDIIQKGDIFQANFQFLLGSGQPSLELTFDFGNYIITKQS